MLIPARKWRQTSKCSVLTRYFPACLLQSQLRHAIRAQPPPIRDGSLLPPHFFLFLIACHLRAWFFALDTAIVCYASICFYTSTFVRSRSAFIRYILSGAKLVTAPLVRKVRARFGATLGAKKISTIIPGQDYSSNSSRPYGSILFRKPCKHFSEHL